MAEIEHVSDTALWVANYRAKETERPDAVFRDPLAAKLVGDRGRAIESQMPYRRMMGWMMVVRTSAIDRLIHEALGRGVDTVLNLGAGLDTRPYRMPLPENLRWVEADFPHMIELKNKTLAGDKPVCRLERVAVDLSDAKARRAFLDRVATGAKCILVVTEGVVPYLSTEDATALARDVSATPHVSFWIQDIYAEHPRGRNPARWRKKMRAAPLKFDAPDYLAFFANLGWPLRTLVGAFDEGQRIGRKFPFIFPWSLILPFMSKKRKAKMRATWGYALLEKR